jgi:hypothetical protein
LQTDDGMLVGGDDARKGSCSAVQPAG